MARVQEALRSPESNARLGPRVSTASTTGNGLATKPERTSGITDSALAGSEERMIVVVHFVR
jgi:hypothetical protein